MENSGLRGRTNGDHLESPIHRHQTTVQLGHPSSAHQHRINLVGCPDDDHQPTGLLEVKSSSSNAYSANFGKGKAVSTFSGANAGNLSRDDEPSFAEDGTGDDSGGAKGEKGSLWQRMKWTDDVVRLLIVTVACVGDDSALEGVRGLKRKLGFVQKKGKWKNVSKLMMRKGCHVSPQQCEDKFNDLNKRYKKLNDILGGGTSSVVENPTLVSSMPHLSAKAKHHVRKILSSKHLFYKEMCSYHNGQKMPHCHDLDLRGGSVTLERHLIEINGLGEGEDAQRNSSNDDDESDSEDNDSTDEYGERMGEYGERNIVKEEYAHLGGQLREHNNFDLSGNFQDSAMSLLERKGWFQKQKLQLLEQRVNIQAQALKLEKQRFKWLRYRSKKDRELEQLRLEKERKRVETGQSILHLRQKEVEMDLRSPETSKDATSLGKERMSRRDQIG